MSGGEVSAISQPTTEKKEFLWKWRTVIALVALFTGSLLTTAYNYLNAPPAPSLTASADAFDFQTPGKDLPPGIAEPDRIPDPNHAYSKFIKLTITNNGKKPALNVRVIFPEGDFLYEFPKEASKKSVKSVAEVGNVEVGQSALVRIWGGPELSEKFTIGHDNGAFPVTANRIPRKPEPNYVAGALMLLFLPAFFGGLIGWAALMNWHNKRTKALVKEALDEKAEADEMTAAWNETVQTLDEQSEGLLAEWAKLAESVVVVSEGKLQVTFYHRDAFAQKSCERKDRCARIEKALQAVTGRPWKLEFASVPDPK